MDARRLLPSVDALLSHPAAQAAVAAHGREPLLRLGRALLDELRRGADAALPDAGGPEAVLERAAALLIERAERAAAPSLAAVINATGVVVHTNLGRAPLAAGALARVAEVASGYSNLEYDLAQGARGSREAHAETRLRNLLGAEAAVVVNNNAAAVMLAVNSFGEGREAIVSRGELVEIGGSFRIPDVLRKGGARLREVGTTNRTRLADYEAALGPETGLILKVHPSNFKVVGFTEEAELPDLVALARRAGVPLVEDLGSGLLTAVPAVAGEPPVAARLAAGVDVVTFSGDKLLGGPQAGLAVGGRERIDAMRRNPLYRALRVDKLTLAALDWTLREHEAGRAASSVPVLRMLSLPAAAVRARAQALLARLAASRPGLPAGVNTGFSAVGGGAAPTARVETALLVFTPAAGPDRFAAALRRQRPPVVARIVDDGLALDLRSVPPELDAPLASAVLAALAEIEANPR